MPERNKPSIVSWMTEASKTNPAEAEAKKDLALEKLRGVQRLFPADHILTTTEINQASRKGACLTFSGIDSLFGFAGIDYILKKAGLPVKTDRENPSAKQWDRKSAKEWIIGFYNKMGRMPTPEDYNKADSEGSGPNFKTIKKLFGNLTDFYRGLRMKSK
jgi:hypothetical protein